MPSGVYIRTKEHNLKNSEAHKKLFAENPIAKQKAIDNLKPMEKGTYAHSLDSRNKISKANKGKPSPNKGKRLSKEGRLKRSEDRKKYLAEHPEALLHLIGNQYYKGKKRSEKWRKEQSLRMQGNKPSIETREKQSEAAKKRKPNFKEKRHTKETSALISHKLKLLWLDQGFRDYMIPKLNRSRKVTIIENVLFNFLCLFFPLSWIQREYYVKPYRIDFAIPSLKLAFEADGENWHDPEKDKIRDEKLLEQGWKTFRFSGSYLYNLRLKI